VKVETGEPVVDWPAARSDAEAGVAIVVGATAATAGTEPVASTARPVVPAPAMAPSAPAPDRNAGGIGDETSDWADVVAAVVNGMFTGEAGVTTDPATAVDPVPEE